MSEPAAVRAPGRGFTLLEVLVAVALLGIVVSVLARSAINGMSYEGDATRRLRASLIADRVLFQVESGLKIAPPKPVHEESEEGEEFAVVLDVQPLELGPTGLDALLPPIDTSGAGGIAARAAAPKQPVEGLTLYRVLVRVAWLEGTAEREVTRSTFAYDATAAAQLLAEPEGGSESGTQPPAEPEQPEEPEEP